MLALVMTFPQSSQCVWQESYDIKQSVFRILDHVNHHHSRFYFIFLIWYNNQFGLLKKRKKNVRITFGFTFLLVSLLTVEQNMFWEDGLVVVLCSVSVVLVLQKMSQSETAWGPKCLCRTNTQGSKSALKRYHTNTATKNESPIETLTWHASK